MVHPPVGQMLGDFLVPRLPSESLHGGRLNEAMLLIIAIVGTTVAPWQRFFQQSYVIDKRISLRSIAYERADLWIGIVFVTVGAVALMAIAAATFAGHPELGAFRDAGGVAYGLEPFTTAPGSEKRHAGVHGAFIFERPRDQRDKQGMLPSLVSLTKANSASSAPY
jgi:Mn2+/Fe2+ NRAMP family transporter